MKQKLLTVAVLVGGAALIFGIVAYWWRGPANNANFPEGTYWVCTNTACKTEFHLTVAELGAWHKAHYGERVQCPKCHHEAERSIKCPSCGAVTKLTRDASPVCPACKKPLPAG
jgi:hypothetical protein